MRSKNFFILFFLSAFTMLANQTITIQNPSNFERIDESMVLHRNQLIVPLDKNLVPVLKDNTNHFVASQLDTISSANSWDELAFVVDLKSLEKKELTIYWVKKSDYPHFTMRTNIRMGKLNARTMKIEDKKSDTIGKSLYWIKDKTPYPYQMDGPAWENDKMGFRQYFDGRNSRDIYGKRVTDMVLDTVGIKPDGLPGDTYHVLAPWGRDIYSCANSFGMGGIGLLYKDKFYRLGILRTDTLGIIDQTSFRILAEGPVRSVFVIQYKGCETPFGKINISHKTTIWAGKIGYESEITTARLPKDCYLITGMVTNFNNQPTIEKTIANQEHLMITHDKQTYNKEYYLGLSLLFPKKEFIESFDLKEIQSWCVKLKPYSGKYSFNVYATWEMQDPKSKSSDYFVDLIEKEAQKISAPVIVSLKK